MTTEVRARRVRGQGDEIENGSRVVKKRNMWKAVVGGRHTERPSKQRGGDSATGGVRRVEGAV